MGVRWNCIALDRNERKAKKTKLDGVLTASETEWAVEITTPDDELVHKSAPAAPSAPALAPGAKLRVGPYELELIDQAGPAVGPAAAATAARAAPPLARAVARVPLRAAQQPAASDTPPLAGVPSLGRVGAARPSAAGAQTRFVPPSMRAACAAGAAAARTLAPPARAALPRAAPPALARARGWCLDGATAGLLAVDPALEASLRPHQKEGMQFAYDCLTGARGPGGGCILAHTMGLGKTIQALGLAATLARVRPLAPRGWAEPVGLTAVACPASLVRAWESEVSKWPTVKAVLGGQRMHVVGASGRDSSCAQRLRDFFSGPRSLSKLVIVSYDQCRRLADALAGAPIDLLICDEGHRLKASAGNQTIAALSRTRAKFRLLLTATPVQNNLSELWAMVSFVLPDGPLGPLGQFRRRFAEPIEASRSADAPDSVRALGAERSAQLAELLAPFTLRRDSSVLRAFLPPRVEWLIFAPLTAEQHAAYDTLAAGALADGARALVAIGRLCALCTHPRLAPRATRGAAGDGDAGGAADGAEEEAERALLGDVGFNDDDDDDDDRDDDGGGDGGDGGGDADSGGGGEKVRRAARPPPAGACVAAGAAPLGTELSAAAADPLAGSAFVQRSGKLGVAQTLLVRLLRETDEKVVVVCRLRATVELMRAICAREGVEATSLDGSTAAAGRQELVEAFNVCAHCRTDGAFRQSGRRSCEHGARGPRVFVLTARAGGVGLTIVGASRMLLLEPDWNPAVDVQAMGRIYREGQTRPTHIYRLFGVSTIDEKILQRQLAKADVADQVVDAVAQLGAEPRTLGFSRDDLRTIFAPHAPLDGTCETAELLEPTTHARRGTLSAAAASDPILSALVSDAGVRVAHACSWDELARKRQPAGPCG
ncbi:hypothetical protein KFE25_003354 [Diacronema lutheri]|uniref:Uncharacterized protein n=1 Tax=Diacronema lutheri TaxID=2081491 RepID=A0A8J5X9J9_DIALT|nr:hypothetical protein KFE25_003354 [Diacronema lutheri]